MSFSDMSDQELREIAKKRIEAKNGVIVHAIVYVFVNIGLWLMYFFTSPGQFLWPIFPTFGWGIGLTAHFFWMLVMLRGTDEQAIDREIERMKSLYK